MCRDFVSLYLPEKFSKMRLIPYLDRSLCGTSLELGTLIIYYFYLIMQIVHVYQDQSVKVEQPELIEKLLKTLGLDGTNMLVNAYTMLDSVLLIFGLTGIHAKKDLFMLPYLVFSGATCGSILFMGLKSLCVDPAVGSILVLLFFLFYYFFIVSYNCYEQIKAENERPQITAPA